MPVSVFTFVPSKHKNIEYENKRIRQQTASYHRFWRHSWLDILEKGSQRKFYCNEKSVHLRNLIEFYQDKMKYDLCISGF